LNYENRHYQILIHFTNDNYLYISSIMPIYKKIVKISKEEYDRLYPEFSYILDLYMSDNQHYVIGTVEDLKAVGINLDSPYY